jgi:hypothetical protein
MIMINHYYGIQGDPGNPWVKAYARYVMLAMVNMYNADNTSPANRLTISDEQRALFADRIIEIAMKRS